MCRWAAWVGKESYLEDVVSNPEQSLIAQSKNALECKTNINADGFGVAWYGQRDEPGLYKNVLPAWSDPNLGHLVQQVKARLYLAHVRASTGTATSYNNCHPFAARNWSFMHNGQVGGFEDYRKAADMLVPDELYSQRRGATDSEVLFLLALGYGLDIDPIGAMVQAVGQMYELAVKHGQAPYMRLAACWSDGRKIYAARYSSDRIAPTVYWQQTDTGVLLVSEPLDSDNADWTLLGAGKCLVATESSVEVQTFFPSSVEVAA